MKKADTEIYEQVGQLRSDVGTLSTNVDKLVSAVSTMQSNYTSALLDMAKARQFTLPMAFASLGSLAIIFAGMAWLVSAIVQPVSSRVDIAVESIHAMQEASADNRQRISDMQVAVSSLTAIQRQQCADFTGQIASLNRYIDSVNNEKLLREALNYQEKNKLPWPAINLDEHIAEANSCR